MMKNHIKYAMIISVAEILPSNTDFSAKALVLISILRNRKTKGIKQVNLLIKTTNHQKISRNTD
jgi:hypothetical protein